MTAAKAIETRYSGYRMRSRLEARWATVFDALGLEWEYEPEGFELSCGRYLPDFYIRTWNLYVEIKPHTQLTDRDREKLATFVHEKAALLILTGTPGQHSAELYAYEHWSSNKYVATRFPVEIVRCGDDDPVVLMGAHDAAGWYCHTNSDHQNTRILCLRFREYIGDCREEFEAGRSARFEFGESGAPRA